MTNVPPAPWERRPTSRGRHAADEPLPAESSGHTEPKHSRPGESDPRRRDNRQPGHSVDRGVPMGAPLFPGQEDATVLIQRITDEADTRVLRFDLQEYERRLQRAGRTATPHPPTDSPQFDPTDNDVTATHPAVPAHSADTHSADTRTAGPTADTQTADTHSAGPTPDSRTADSKTAKTSGVVRAGALMAVATLASRITGFIAKALLLAVLGVYVVSDSYNLANTLPNIVFELVIGGVLTSVAIPLLSRARSDPDGGAEYTQRLMTTALVGLLIVTVLAVVAAPIFTSIYLSGDTQADPELTTDLARLLLPQIFFYGLAALFGAILNTKERFAAPAWAPVVNNLVVIVVAILVSVTPGGILTPNGLQAPSATQLLLLGLGTTAGIVAQAAVMLPSLLRSGFRFRWRWGNDPRLAEAGRLMLWSIGYALVSAIGFVVSTRVFTDNLAGSLTAFSFASMLFQLPYGILGVSVLTAIMPRMSRHAADGDLGAVKNDALLANRLSMIALLPVSAAMLVLATPLAVITAGYGNASAAGVSMIGGSVAGMAFGLVPLAVSLVQMRVFYAMKDARTPTIINAVMVTVRIPLVLICGTLRTDLIPAGIALATTISYAVGAAVGEIWLRARFGSMRTGRLLSTLTRMTIAAGLAGGASWLYLQAVADPGLPTTGGALLQLAIGGVIGLAVLIPAMVLLRVPEVDPIRRKVGALLGFDPKPDRTRPEVAPSRGRSASGPVAGSPPRPQQPAVHAQLGARPPAVADPSAADTVLIPKQEMPALPDTPDRTTSSGPDDEASDDALPTPQETAHRTARSSRISLSEQVAAAAAADAAEEAAQASGVSGGLPGGGLTGGGLTGGGLTDAPGSADPTVALNKVPLSPSLAATSGSSSGPATGQPAGAANLADLAPGMNIGGRYRLVAEVAVDSAGDRFWRAKDTVLPRDMAVTLLPDSSGTSATVARTLRAGRLHHIGLPQTLDLGTEHGQTFVVGQWVDGATLTDLLARGPLEPAVAVSITSKLSEAVAEAHRNGLALGSISPSLVRVNVDGQVRFSHVIAHANATTQDDIRAVGGLMYLMLTGTWPESADLPKVTGADLPTPPRVGDRELPANEVNPDVPAALATVAERALHPEDPGGINAIGAVAALLRSPEATIDVASSGAAVAPMTAVESPPPTMSPADRRLRKERRIKLGLATGVLAAFVAMILIVVASWANQTLTDIEDANKSSLEDLGSIGGMVSPTTAAPESSGGAASTPATASSGSAAVPPSATGATRSSVVAAAPVGIVGGTLYDPEPRGAPDNPGDIPLAFDGDPSTAWKTDSYKAQFKTREAPEYGYKVGVGIILELDREVSVQSVQVTTQTPGITVQILGTTSPNPPTGPAYAGVPKLGSAQVGDAPAVIPVTGAPRSKYIGVFLTSVPQDGQFFTGALNEIVVRGS